MAPQVGTSAEPKESARDIVLEPIFNRRPNTVPPSSFFKVDSAWLMSLGDAELIEFADQYLGIVVPMGTKRTTILTRIVNAATGAEDG